MTEAPTEKMKNEQVITGHPEIKVSIITPAYNAEKYIEETIQSVKAQSHSNWEMIVIDDGSTDNTASIVAHFAKEDGRIILIKNGQNKGVALSRNEGLKIANGKYAAFLDSDDLWDEDKIKKQLDFMETNHCVITFTSYQKFSAKTREYGKVIKAPKSVSAEELLGNTIIGCLTVMVNREEAGEFYMPNLKHMEDQATWYSIMQRGYEAYGLPDVLAYYREEDKSLLSNKAKAAKLQWNVYRSYFRFSVGKSVGYFAKYAKNAVKKYI